MKKLNKLFAILVAMAMVLSLGVASAFALDITTPGDSAVLTNGTATVPADIAVEKVLNAADGITIPEKTYTFTVTADETNPAPVTGLASVSATIDNSDRVENANKATDITSGIFANAGFTAIGNYKFTVQETAGAATDTIEDVTYNYTYDTSEYTVIAAVAQDADTGTFYIDSIAVTNEAGEKQPIIKVGDNYVFDIENTLTAVKDGALTISKTVTGDEGFDTAKEFNFHVTVTAPATAAAGKVYNATLYKGAEDTTGTPLTFTSGESTPVALAHGWNIVFNDIDYGAKYIVTEDDYTAIGYTASGEVENAAVVSDSTANAADVTNTYDDDKDETKTGITMNNLPFIVLALVALGGLVAYVVVRRRNADEA